jgi:hypothetical protein
VYLLLFHAFINEMQVQEAKSPVKNLIMQCCMEGFNSGVKGLRPSLCTEAPHNGMSQTTTVARHKQPLFPVIALITYSCMAAILRMLDHVDKGTVIL